MEKITYLTPNFAVVAQLAPEDFPEAARLGFRAIIINRPDGEEEGQLGDRGSAVNAWRAGLQYRFIPSSKLDLFTDEVVGAFERAQQTLQGPVLGFCKSGLRSAIIWAAASARSMPVDEVLAILEKAEFDLDFLRDDLEAQADRRHWKDEPVPADWSAILPAVPLVVVAA